MSPNPKVGGEGGGRDIRTNVRLTPKPNANLQTITKTPAKFQKNRFKTVRGLASTSYPSHCVCGWKESQMDGQTDKPILIVPFD